MLVLGVKVSQVSAQNTKEERDMLRKQAVAEALDKREYTVSINYMMPRRGRGHALSSQYSIEVRNDSLFSHLPYLGRAYSVPYGGGKALNFDAPVSGYASETRKKGIIRISMKVCNEEDYYTYILNVYPDGDCDLYVQPQQRESISFRGVMETNADKGNN